MTSLNQSPGKTLHAREDKETFPIIIPGHFSSASSYGASAFPVGSGS